MNENVFWVCQWGIMATILITIIAGGYIYNVHDDLIDARKQILAAEHIAEAVKDGADPIEARCAFYWENKAVCVAAAATRK